MRPTPETHDAFRRVRGSYDWTMKIIEAAAALDLSLQINTTISRLTLPHLAGHGRPGRGVSAVALGRVLSGADRPRRSRGSNHG